MHEARLSRSDGRLAICGPGPGEYTGPVSDLWAGAAVDEARAIVAEIEPDWGSATSHCSAVGLGRAYRGEWGGVLALQAAEVVEPLAEALAGFVGEVAS